MTNRKVTDSTSMKGQHAKETVIGLMDLKLKVREHFIYWGQVAD